MNNYEFIEKLKDVVNNYKTIYMWGCFGQEVTESIIVAKTKQYPSWYTAERQKKFRNLIGKNYFGFDCVCLIKGILWGWNGDTSKAHGGAVYGSNGVPDTDANGMINKCNNISTDFNNITPGEAVWLSGHIGVYIGNGQVIECTPIWKDGVQITNLNQRNWVKHGKLPYITYESNTETPKQDPIPSTNDTIYTVIAGDTLTKIAKQFGTTIDAIVNANGIKNKNLIITGQKLVIPGTAKETTPSTPAEPKTKIVNPAVGLYMRSEPSLNSSKIKAYSKGTKVTIIAENVANSGGYTWDKVQVGSTIGYMANKYLV